MPRLRYIQFPAVTLTEKEMRQRTEELNKRSRKSLDLKKLGNPVAQPKPKRKSPSGGDASTPQSRSFCRVLSPEEWSLVFPEYPSDYGGMVCYR